jgi:cleavage and polyadenylation specificity factor subunit 2
MGRIAIIEEVEGIRDEQDVGDDSPKNDEDGVFDDTDASKPPPSTPPPDEGPRVSTVQEVHEAFDFINTLRYSQPTHLQGLHPCILSPHPYLILSCIVKGSARG